jgi:hypothetical protein
MISHSRNLPWIYFFGIGKMSDDGTSLSYGLRPCFEERNQEERTEVCLLQIHELMAHIMLAGPSCTTQTAYDQFFPEYQKIMEPVGYVYPHPVKAKHGEPLYQFDLGIIIAMSLVDSTAHLLSLKKEYRVGHGQCRNNCQLAERNRRWDEG